MYWYDNKLEKETKVLILMGFSDQKNVLCLLLLTELIILHSFRDTRRVNGTAGLSSGYGMCEIIGSISSCAWVFLTGYLDESGLGKGGA